MERADRAALRPFSMRRCSRCGLNVSARHEPDAVIVCIMCRDTVDLCTPPPTKKDSNDVSPTQPDIISGDDSVVEGPPYTQQNGDSKKKKRKNVNDDNEDILTALNDTKIALGKLATMLRHLPPDDAQSAGFHKRVILDMSETIGNFYIAALPCSWT
jgi:hypothetical protein